MSASRAHGALLACSPGATRSALFAGRSAIGHRRSPAIALLIGAWMCASNTVAPAQSYPDRPVRVLVPFAPGGGNDIIARAVGRKLSEMWGQQVVVDNRGGAGGNIAGEIAARAAPDGYTLFQFNVANAIAPALYSNLPYDPVKDFAAITLIASAPFLIVTHPGHPARNVADLIALARPKPGSVTFASGGTGSSTHLAAELFRLRAGINMVHVPYKGGGPALIDVLGGQVDLYFASTPPALPYIRSGRLRALAITGLKRSSAFAELPTVIESGIAGYESSAWYGLVAPSGIGGAIVRKLHADTTRVLAMSDVREFFEAQGAELIGNTPEQFRRHIADEVVKWAQVVRQAGVRGS